MLKILFVVNSLIWSSAVAAAMEMQKTIAETTTEFRYQWPPEPEINFVLENAQIKTQSGSNRRYSKELADQHIRHQVLLAAVKMQQPGVRVQISPKNLPFRITVNGSDSTKVATTQQQLQKVQKQAYQSYLKRDFYYLMKSPTGEKFVIPDHVRVMRQSRSALQPVSKAFVDLYGNNNIRQISGKINEWIQQIPYQDLSDRQASAGSGYSPPLKLLVENAGDCDSKAVLFAAVLQNIFPKISIGVLYFPDHAVVAAQVPPLESELTVTLQGITYLVIDPTGPAPTKLGSLAQKYQTYLNNRQFTHRLF
ncbi:MAG: hypothetical protein KJ930_01465 [Gammaproteobacteria bacterium]|nr:hypothetical protein [Gammaproteobacteria bacterium]MBU2224699.1 hypothetical protein [Gammaproteobacteria bacterium]